MISSSAGVSIVYISHHLKEALQITDHAVVLRDGIMTASAPHSEIDLEWIVRNPVDKNFVISAVRPKATNEAVQHCLLRIYACPRLQERDFQSIT